MSVAQLDIALDRPMPQSSDAERAVLGSILINNHAFYRVIGTIDTDDFFKDAHRTIFATMRRMAERSQEIETLTLKEELSKNALLDQAGGVAYISSLLDSVPDVANVERYARIVKEKSTLRRLIVMGNSVMRAALDAPGEPEEVLNVAEKSLFQIAEGTVDKAFTSVDKIARRNLADIEQIKRAGRSVTGIPTGYDRFNDMTSGFQKQDLIIIAARPSMGKAQPLDARVLTRRGFVCMGSLQVGNELASIDGAPSRVIGIFPQGERQLYRVEFSDGRDAECCAEHLWRISYRGWKAPRVMTTERLMELLQRRRYQNRLYIDTFNGEFGHDTEHTFDPWLLGFLIGDGSLRGTSICFSTSSTEILNRVSRAVGSAYAVNHAGAYDYRISQKGPKTRGRGYRNVNALKEALEALGLWGCVAQDKFIPKEFFSKSRNTRTQLLKGLIDSDGWIEKWGSIRFCSASERLALDVVDLVRSLGGTASYSKRIPSFTCGGQHRAGRPAYVCNIQLPDQLETDFIATKQNRRKTRLRTRRLNVRSITPTRFSQTQCIAVSHPSHLYITDGYTVTHNTSFMMNIAEAIAIPDAQGLPRTGGDRLHAVGVFSLEMSKEQIGLRILSSESGVPMHMLRSGINLSDKSWRALAEAASRISKGQIFVDDTPGIDPLEMRAKARRLRHEIALDIVMVDYLQLMSVKGKIESRQQEISLISRSLKAMAKELDLPLISLSQLSRRPEQRTGDHKPQLADLRESGSIEQDADMVCFIYRDEVYNKEAEKGKAEIIIAKQRNGPIGDFPLVFLHEVTKFMNFEPTPDYMPGG
jgi:replicative DNA helicase